MDHKQLSERLRGLPLFAGLDDESWARLSSFAEARSFAAGACLFHLGDEPDDIYVILDGVCAALLPGEPASTDDSTDLSADGWMTVAEIGAGGIVGELSLLSPDVRSATVQATTALEAAAFPIAAMRELLLSEASSGPYTPLLQRLFSTVASKLKGKHQDVVQLRRGEVDLLRQRSHLSTLLVYLVSLLCGWFFLTHWLKDMSDLSTGTTVITAPLIVVLLGVCYRPIRAMGLGWDDWGIRWAGWRLALWEGLLFSLPLIALATAARAVLLPEQPLFDLVETLARQKGSLAGAWLHFVGLNLAYGLLVVPLQELLSRGLLQGLLERLIEGQPARRMWLAILISNLVFSAFHIYLSMALAVVTFFLGVYLGWLYARTRHLLAPIVAHAAVGMWVLTVIRLQQIL